jgi:hypothetical protein
MIPRENHPKESDFAYTNKQIRVWDIVAQSWRSMKVENIVEVQEYKAEIAVAIS